MHTEDIYSHCSGTSNRTGPRGTSRTHRAPSHLSALADQAFWGKPVHSSEPIHMHPRQEASPDHSAPLSLDPSWPPRDTQMELPEQDLARAEPGSELLWNQYCTCLTELEVQREGRALPRTLGAWFLSGLALWPWARPGLFWASVSCVEVGG